MNSTKQALLSRLVKVKKYLQANVDEPKLKLELTKLIDSTVAQLSNHQLSDPQPKLDSGIDLENRLLSTLIKEIKAIIICAKQAAQQRIKVQKQQLASASPETVKQQLNQLVPRLNRQQNRACQKIKQQLHRHKSLLINPFSQTGLIWQTQQIIQAADIKITQEKSQSYLALVVQTSTNKSKIESKLHCYLADLYQQEFQQQLEQQWHKIQEIYAAGGLKEMRQQLQAELQPVAFCGDIKLESLELQSISSQPTFKLWDVAYLPILAEGSRAPFEYHYSQSKWFRLLVASIAGLIIYLVTKLLSGEGRFFGFMIVVFQFINLFIGQDARELRLKQQAKDLRRSLDNKYQILVRLSAEKITQDLIAALDNEHQSYQQQIETIAQAARKELLKIQELINQEQEQIKRLQKLQQELISLIQHP